MTVRPKIFDDLAGVAGGAISALAGLKQELAALAGVKAEEAVQRLNLVRRDEFEAIAEVARRAREEADVLKKRLETLEANLR